MVSNQSSNARVSYVSAPRFECTDGTSIEADSSVTFEATSFTQLFGEVIFRDGQRELYADRAQFFSRVGRLQAQGSVRFLNLEDGSLMTGEDLVLLQESDNRAEEDVIMREGRPHARLIPRVGPDSTAVEGSAGASRPEDSDETVPYEVDADLIHLVGNRLFQARGRVAVTQEALQAYGDSLEFQMDIGWLTLFENARVLSQDTVSGDTLDVRGDTITMDLPNDRLDELEARGRARLLAGDVDMRGPMIRLVFEDEELERVFAVQRAAEEELAPVSAGEEQQPVSTNPTQPRAVAEDFVLTGDSIKADLLGGELDRVTATGTARGVSTARDSLNTDTIDELFRADWIEGDTIIATFRSVSVDSGEPPTDGRGTAELTERQIDRLVARGQARSFYRSTPETAVADGAIGPEELELSYVIGDEVRLFMKDGEVERMEVDNPTGVYLQPGRTPADSVAPGGNGDNNE